MSIVQSLQTILGDRAVACDAMEGQRRGSDFMTTGHAPVAVAYPIST